jgi:hypothetical protein
MPADLAVKVNQVTNHRREKLADAFNDATVNERRTRGIGQLQPQSAVHLLHFDGEVLVLV